MTEMMEQTAQTSAVGTGNGVVVDDFLTGFGEEADQPGPLESIEGTESTFDQEEDTTSEEAENKTASEDRITLKHLGMEKQVTMPELQVLAQKGLDYDRIREKYDGSKEELALLHTLAEKAGKSPAEYLQGILSEGKERAIQNRANQLVEAGALDEDLALAMAKTEYDKQDLEQEMQRLQEEKRRQEQEQQTEAAKEQALQDDLTKLLSLRPELVKDPTLPEAVVKMVQEEGMLPTVAYLNWENQKMKLEMEQWKQTEKNRQKTPGSLQGQAEGEPDLFLQGFDSI